MPPVVTGSHEGEALAMCAVIVLTTQKENGAKGEDPGTKGSAEWVLVLAVNIVVLSCPQALGQQACKPTMTFIEARYSAMQLPKLQRTWTAVLSVDASQSL
jgi:hypothetical protein